MRFRSNIVALTVLLIGAAIGLGTGYALCGQAEPRQRATEKPVPIEIPSSHQPIVPAQKADEPAARPEPTADFKALMDKWYAEERATPHFGAGEIHARVVDRDGKEISGIKVCCRWSSYNNEDNQPYLKDFDNDRDRYMEGVTRYHLRTLKRMDTATLQQVSATDGSVSFSRVPEKGAWLYIEDRDYRLAGPNDYQQVPATPGKSIELRLVRLCEVEVIAVAAEAPAGIKIVLYISPFEGRDEQCNAEVGVTASLRLPPGIYTLRLASRDSRVSCLPVEFELKHGEGPLAVTLNVEIKPQIHGTVIFWGCTPARAEIVVVRLRDGLNDDALLDPTRLRDAKTFSVSDKGAFWVTDLSRGEYLIALRVSGKILAKMHATASLNSSDVVLSVSGPPAEECLIVNLYLPSGQAQYTPEFTWAGKQGTRIDSFQVWGESPTRYRLWVGPPPKDGKEQEGTLTVTLQSYGTASTATQTLHGEVLVTFQKTVTMRILLKNVPEELRREIYLTCNPAHGPQSPNYIEERGFMDRTLSFRAARLQPGKYLLTAHVRTLGDAADVTTNFEVQTDMGPFEFALPDYNEIRFDAGKLKTEPYAYVRTKGTQRSRTVSFGSDGIAIVPWMEAGKYALNYYVGSESRTFEFTVTGDETFTLPRQD